MSYCPGIFGYIIYNKAQCLKNPFIHSHISIAWLRALILNFLTATLMINWPIDLIGFLHLVWNPKFNPKDLELQDDSADETMVSLSNNIN